ncbi:hypothetical protein IW261DRAFT_1424769 [Armillaria novae-zelandiae]|uniref:Uncharacterized protein n=1 Tax=Armillaria novae-zelandiae TaxID=153914 RepID=A0AA39NTY5_9AGAR|nr:hypothetical protein IW261DRAFT_1424769 [Armillaria novae-zelandiae]
MIKTLEPPKAPVFSTISNPEGRGCQISLSISSACSPCLQAQTHAGSTRFTKSSAPIPPVKLSKPAITRRGTRTSARKAKVAPAQEPLAVLAKIQTLAHSSGNVGPF